MAFSADRHPGIAYLNSGACMFGVFPRGDCAQQSPSREQRSPGPTWQPGVSAKERRMNRAA